MEHTPQRPLPQGMPRLTRQQAKATAAVLASAIYDRDEAGNMVRVTDPKARGLLERAFAQLIQRGGKPFAMQISANEAAAFPSHTPITGGSYALAVGFDIDRYATFSTAGAAGVCDDRPVDATRLAERIAMMGLERGLRVAGIPERGRA